MSQAFPLFQPVIKCECGAHRLHRVFRFAWENPSASRKDCAKALDLSYNNVLAAFHRLKQRDLTRYCPECFHPELFDGVCQNCGFEPAVPMVPVEARPDSQSPVNWLHPGNLLGSETQYDRLGFANHGFVLRRRLERGIGDQLTIAVKSEVENELKRTYPSDAVADEAGRLVVKEVLEFKARYPGLASSKNVRKQLAENVINRLRLLHPHLRPITRLPDEGVV